MTSSIGNAFPVPRFPTMLRKMWSGGEVQRWFDENVQLEVAAWEVTNPDTGVVTYVANFPGFVQSLRRGDRLRPLYSLASGVRD
jgi:hypothetical protein